MEPSVNWTLSSVVYQIYPRSFQDSNGDGIGDLKGIEQRLDYLSDLGINAIWLSPVYKSPQADFGYDISDYNDIDPIFGTLGDFDNLVKSAHEKNIKIIMDYVPNHTSIDHDWFKESRSSTDSPKRDWYIWKDPKPDGSVPNNWLSPFGGSVWELDGTTNQYYLHTWDKAQPDLNWRNPQVEQVMLNVLRFWINRGIDGFRVDAIDWLFKDTLFRDEPADPTAIQEQIPRHEKMLHPYTLALPETIDAMKKIVKVLREYKGKFIVAESHLTLHELIQRYMAVGWKWYQPFNFSLINLPWRADVHKQYIDEYDKALGDMYIPCYVIGNHDQHRVASRIGEKQARVAAVLQLMQRGLPFIYYGEEIGMTDTQIPKDKIVDTYEIHSPGLNLGRDPERTPMQWDDSANGGFSNAKPWLPVNENYTDVNVAAAKKDPKSTFSLYKLLIKTEGDHPALKEGVYVPLPHPANNVLAFIREKDADKILILLNFDDKPKKISMEYKNCEVICSATMTSKVGETVDLNDFILPGDEGYVIKLGSL